MPTPAGDIPRVNILGVGVHALDMTLALEACESAIEEQRKGYICVTGVHGVMEAQRDAAFKAILNRSILTVPDGMPTVWFGHLTGHRRMGRVFGPDFMLELCHRSVARGYRHFLLGGKPGVAEELRRALIAKCPGIEIAGTFTPPFRPLNDGERRELRATFEARRPQIVWVGLSTPKQERFMAEFLPLMTPTLMVGVGAAFDIHTGRLRDAPEWMKRSGLQWLHRLSQDPRRLWKRYLVNNPRFVAKAIWQLAGLKQYSLSP